ncbi:DEAD/DEAH box helicase family protein [Mycoplasmopsis felis]|uniref:DEAD/DEAH box helicase family protein n=1 Tax=Mycoplasmopsis felis TaxID=33923 RepID=UPI003A5C825F
MRHLLLDYKHADLVIFVVDRTELGTQTFREFGSFGDQNSLNVLKVKSTKELVKTILKNSNRNSLIISSIQKQNNINPENFDQKTLEKLKDKRVVFIFDECHRSTFGLMYDNIINSFPKSILFGFTGTPIKVENNKNGLSTIDNFDLNYINTQLKMVYMIKKFFHLMFIQYIFLFWLNYF